MPVTQFYPETAFGGDFQTEAIYRDGRHRCGGFWGAGGGVFPRLDAMATRAL
jgi:hypothetical protein